MCRNELNDETISQRMNCSELVVLSLKCFKTPNPCTFTENLHT